MCERTCTIFVCFVLIGIMFLYTEPENKIDYVHSSTGLYPAPLPRNAKASLVNKVKAKFKFLGKFMAKALMDSRMVNIFKIKETSHIVFLTFMVLLGIIECMLYLYSILNNINT